MRAKELFINQIPQIEIDGSKNVPTTIFYPSAGKVLIGSSALAAAEHQHEIIRDFKIDLGFLDPNPVSKAARRTFITTTGERKSAASITSDFLREVLRHTNKWLVGHGVAKGTCILLAEPLKIPKHENWLANYRGNLKRILDRKFAGEGFENIDLKNIDFMPEPFAVFQYYRYGIRHPFVAQKMKYVALVIDFGGGTFDSCIIETTNEGDIKKGGKNSEPLGARSEPVGGFYVNQVVAEELFRKCVISKSEKTQFKRGLDLYAKWRENEIDLETIQDELANFVVSFHDVVYAIEDPKLSLCKSITNWALDASLHLSVSIPLPKDPFSIGGESIHAPFSASELRDVFIRRVWEQKLRNAIRETIHSGKEKVGGASISVVLLSGGSANIRWLEKLLNRDFADELSDAEILWLPDFQEVVARGLAAECTRRFHTRDRGGDFSSVTYNQLCLILDPDKTGHTVGRFKPRTEGLPNPETPGVLLPSATCLKNFIEKPMRWRVQLKRPPRRQLDYYFLRSSFDPSDYSSLQNLEETALHTPQDCSFDAHFQVELLVKEDGTAIPKFVYKTGRTEAEAVAKDGKPFYLDMTYSQTSVEPKAYIGLDFGTSNTSISFVDESSVQYFEKRSGEREISELVTTLPYPLAVTLQSYLGQFDPSKLPDHAREFIEAALAMAAYVTYTEYCLKKGQSQSKLFEGFAQRSAGPLWRLLQNCLMHLGKNGEISAPYQELMTAKLYKLIDEAIDFIAQQKHHKVSDTALDLLQPVKILANISQKVFTRNAFGFFEYVKRQKFTASRQYTGLFRHACSSSTPFFKVSEYEGPEDFPEAEPFLLNVDSGTALSLQPLIFWERCPRHPDIDPGHCYIYDIQPDKDEGRFSFKAAGFPCTCEVSVTNQYSDLAKTLLAYKEADLKINSVQVGSIRDVSEE
ncbi:MAG: hypothetical protein HY314_10135 [Acidobacteria bacterium]|nr:hypothetical protein [Acidobacteriota bacterium]